MRLRSSEGSKLANRPDHLKDWKEKNSVFGSSPQSRKELATSPYFKVTQRTESMKKIRLASTGSAHLAGISTMSPTGGESPSY